MLGRFSMLFPLPVEHINPSDLVDVWFHLFKDCDEAQFMAAARTLVLSLRRFPFPADFVDAMQVPPVPSKDEAATAS